jgi:hypothetical protein
MQGVLEKQRKRLVFSTCAGLVPMSFVGGGSDGSDTFQHAAFTGSNKKDKSSSAEGEAVPGYRKRQRILN